MPTKVHLSQHERMQILELSRDGLPQAEIGRRLRRNKATISRELRRNSADIGYLPETAQWRYRARRQRRRLRQVDRRLRREVIQHLTQGWSPEHLAADCRTLGGQRRRPGHAGGREPPPLRAGAVGR